MDSARLGGSGRTDSSPCHSRENGNPGRRTKCHVTPEKENADYTNLSLRAPRRRGPQSRERAFGTVCLFVLDARLIGRFPLMPLAWIPASAGMTLVEGRYSWCASIVGATLFRPKF